MAATGGPTGMTTMPKDKTPDPVAIAKLISKATNVPLANVAQIMQKHPLDAKGYQKAMDECAELAATFMRAQMKKINPF
jgi:hypothetical protein